MKFLLYIALVSFVFTQETFTKIPEYTKLTSAYKMFLQANISEAREGFEKGASAADLYNTAYLYFYEGNLVKATEFADKAIKAAKKNDVLLAWSYFLRSNIAFKEQNESQMILYLSKALKEEDSFAEFHFFLGDYYVTKQRYEKAMDAYESGLDIEPDASDYHVKMARMMERKKSVPAALEYLVDKLGELYPTESLCLYLGNTYRARGNFSEAKYHYKRYLEFHPHGKESSSVKNTLIGLGETLSGERPADDKNTDIYKLRLGEKLEYNVSYLFSLGGMKITVDKDTVNRFDLKTARVTYALKSGAIGLNSIFEVYIDLKTLNSVQSILLKRSDEKIPEIKMYRFNQKTHQFSAYVINKWGRVEIVHKQMPIATQDGTGILYYARGLVANKQSRAVTTVIDEKFKLTDIFYRNYLDSEEALGKEDDYIYIDAKAHYKGVAGMNGDARGWFSKDGEYTPLVGKMSIIVGSVRVELESRK